MPRNDSFLEALGRKIAGLRKEAGMTQETLAERAGLTGKYLSEIERGLVNPSILTLRAIAGGLGITLARLLAESAELDLEVAALLDGTSAEERARALAVMRALLAFPPEG